MVDVKTQERERGADDLKSKPEVERDGKSQGTGDFGVAQCPARVDMSDSLP